MKDLITFIFALIAILFIGTYMIPAKAAPKVGKIVNERQVARYCSAQADVAHQFALLRDRGVHLKDLINYIIDHGKKNKWPTKDAMYFINLATVIYNNPKYTPEQVREVVRKECVRHHTTHTI